MHQTPQPRPTRRALLGGALAAGAGLSLSGCGVPWSKVRVDFKGTPAPPTLSPDDLARFAAVEAVTSARDLAARTTTGDLAALAADALTWHSAHLNELGPLPGPVPSGSPTPSGWPTSTPTPAADLAAAEQAVVTALLVGVEDREPGLATLLTSIATCSAGLVEATGATVQVPVPDVRGSLPQDAGEEVTGPFIALLELDRYAGYAYGPLAASLTGEDRARALAAMRAHQDRALRVDQLLVTAGVTAPPAPPAYDVPVPSDVANAIRAAGDLEASCAEAAAALIRAGERPGALLGIGALTHAGRLQSQWGRPVAFPGLPQLS